MSCGRGYSGHGDVPTLYVQSVSSGGVFTAYSQALDKASSGNVTTKMDHMLGIVSKRVYGSLRSGLVLVVSQGIYDREAASA